MFSNAQRADRAQYEILRVVNRGGMGEIALGRAVGTKGFEKLVVLKRLRADAEREDHLEMFDVEQEVMSRLEHPNIVKVFDQPVIENIPYLAMEYVRGRNLDQVIREAETKNTDLSVQYTLSIAAEILRGLAYVHRLKDGSGTALGVVHQDMTPSNVMVSFFGEVKITDFGISYITSRDGGLRKGVLKGKPRYVAPEVLAGKRVNNRADIYGVGLILYEMLTRRALFARTSVKDTLAAVARNELPDFDAELRGLAHGLPRVLRRALAKDPQERYRTSEEMAAEVLNELAPLGGPMTATQIGYKLRGLFAGDPDIPEMDPALEAALSQQGRPTRAGALEAMPNLDQTLSELDRLLGPDDSVDVFTLPPELVSELADLEDNDPFKALTPIPDFVWEVQTERELLERAAVAYPDAVAFPSPSDGPFDAHDPHRASATLGDTPELVLQARLSPAGAPAHAAEIQGEIRKSFQKGALLGLFTGLGFGITIAVLLS
jgi:serine/threonine protein kinase